MRLPDGAKRHPRLQRAWTWRPEARLFASPKRTQALFDEKSAEALRGLLHRSPRDFGRDSSLWTLEMAAEVSFEEGLVRRRVSGETVRATLARFLGVRWQPAKRWITSPDPLYERKKDGATD